MNKEELIKEYDEKAKALRDEFISKLEDDKKEFEVELPEDGERLYCIDNFQSTILSKIFDISNMNDVKRFEDGLFFETKEEAEQHLKERKLLFKLHQWTKIKNDGWKPDWEDDNEEKYYIANCEFDSPPLSCEIAWGVNRFSKFPYFKTEEIAKKCIKLFGNEIKEVLC